MVDAMANLGQKVVEAARMAVAMHLYRLHSAGGSGELLRQQQVVIGGAGPAFFKDEELPSVARSVPGRPGRSSRPSVPPSPQLPSAAGDLAQGGAA